MNPSIVILVVVVALAVAWFWWSRRERPPLAALPRPAHATASPAFASYDEYRRSNPSHMVYGKLTCNRCGSNLIAARDGIATCSNCGAALYRA